LGGYGPFSVRYTSAGASAHAISDFRLVGVEAFSCGLSAEGLSVFPLVLVNGLVEFVGQGWRHCASPDEDVAHVRLADAGCACQLRGGAVAVCHVNDCAEAGLRDLACEGLGGWGFEGYDLGRRVRFLFAGIHGRIFAQKWFSGMIDLERRRGERPFGRSGIASGFVAARSLGREVESRFYRRKTGQAGF
jgi:hypothetical protein